MKILCGTDIIEINRIKEAIETLGERFKNRVYTPEEIEYCESKKEQKYQHYAARFAAKEAVFKSISELLIKQEEMTWKSIEVKKEKSQKPFIQLHHLNLIKNIDIQIDLSMSHCKEYATAVSTVTVNEEGSKE
ncbi:MAG TPA: holo-ACP synthase [Candidatus Merdicola faecigallinarum]|uniref:Holo-[acyl-carrier-protein] synthase n=1 Tax=Candidatus Merdicola faecigallinarum TaxID=2840862 RepID=A0A9D1M1Q7_9FIRM|nr:holo-ACP synthase [Candidatus Merdicola faecigallinarum]